MKKFSRVAILSLSFSMIGLVPLASAVELGDSEMDAVSAGVGASATASAYSGEWNGATTHANTMEVSLGGMTFSAGNTYGSAAGDGSTSADSSTSGGSTYGYSHDYSGLGSSSVSYSGVYSISY